MQYRDTHCESCGTVIDVPFSNGPWYASCEECCEDFCTACCPEVDYDVDGITARCPSCCITRDLPEGWAVETIK